MNVLVTGAGGLVGRTLAPMLAEGHDVVLLDVSDPGTGFPCRVGDLRDEAFVVEACQGMDAVVHTAALHGKAWADVGDDVGFHVNVVGTYHVLEAARQARVRRVVFTSSVWANGHPPTAAPYLPIDEETPRGPVEVYGLTKRLGEQMCVYASSQYGLSTICLRPGGIIPADVTGARRFSLLFGAVDVRDVALAHVLALEAPAGLVHEVCNITADSPLCQVEPADFFADSTGVLEDLVPGIGGWMAGHQVSVPPRPEWYSIELARSVLGYYPRHNFTLTP